jgi:hypothetical protein
VESIHTVALADIEMPEEKTGRIRNIPVGHGTGPGPVVGDMTASINISSSVAVSLSAR